MAIGEMISAQTQGATPAASEERALEEEILRIGREIFSAIQQEKPSFWQKGYWNARILESTLGDESFKVNLFRFIDVLPGLKTPEQVAQHLHAYFGAGENLPEFFRSGMVRWGADAALHSRLAARALDAFVRRIAGDVATRFIAGETPAKAMKTLHEYWRRGRSATLDLLGEKVVNEDEAEEYLRRYLELLDACAEAMPAWGPAPDGNQEHSPRINISVKPSALCPRLMAVDMEGSVLALKDRLRPIMIRARELGAFINLDMETMQTREITHRAFEELVGEPELAGYEHFGLVIQAYYRDSMGLAREFLEFCRRSGTRYTVRLAKGAYWDYETVMAAQRGWPCPVFQDKRETDASFERVLRLLLENHQVVRTAVASHNIRSLAVCLAYARALDVPEDSYEFQMLHGMAVPVEQALVERGQPVRIYAPIGDLLEGMSYLVRRLLENTSNESFLRQSFMEHRDADKMLEAPLPPAGSPPGGAALAPEGVFRNEPLLDFSFEENRLAVQSALAGLKSRLPLEAGPIIGGEETAGQAGRGWLESENPADSGMLVARVALAGIEDAEAALALARKTSGQWADTPPRERCAILRRAAELFRRERASLMALMILETGKSWQEADGDLAEAVDFLNYYAWLMERLPVESLTQEVPGEENHLVYQPRGVGVVIAPWNFPLAISTGMTAAGLVTGNCILYKPAESSPMTGVRMTALFHDAGVPAGALACLPGLGPEVGAHLARHPEVSFVAFTGSLGVGLELLEGAGRVPPGQHIIKRVVAEMGGKNAIIVDDDADLDEAVRGIMTSAFGFQGQKCSAASRVVALDGIYDRLAERLAGAVRDLRAGPPADPGSDIGPLINRAALEKVRHYIELGRTQGRVLAETAAAPEEPAGWFAAPVLLDGLPEDSALLADEIFGPVLVLQRARSFAEALQLASHQRYRLTGGLYSRHPEHISRARREFQVGNLYINRPITGAIVQRQPFGGLRLSGSGFKAGGPDYLLQFMDTRTISENVLRQGFAPVTRGFFGGNGGGVE